VDVEMIGGCMVNRTLTEDMLCRLPEIRYSAVVVDWDEATSDSSI
jgi:hypothetical protein